MIEEELATTDHAARDRQDAGRAGAFALLADRQLARSYRLATVLLGSEAEAQDAVQDAAAIAWEQFADLRDEGRFEAWFQRILVNGCRDRVRRRGHVRLLRLDDGPDHPSADPTVGFAERAALHEALQQLPHDQREVVVLRYVSDLTLEEIAERTGDRLGTVKSRLHYGLRALRAAYDAAARSPGEPSR
jgi:RNA polymerase sigma-70 factor, ECF subfamily